MMENSAVSKFDYYLKSAKTLFDKFGIITSILVLICFFSLGSDKFFTYNNLVNILQQICLVSTIAIGTTVVILVGGIDLSPGSVVLLSGTVIGVLLKNNVPLIITLFIGLTVSSLVGLLNGFLIEKVNISAPIVTLSMMIAVRGIAQIILSIYSSWVWIEDPLLISLSTEKILNIPIIVYITLLMYLLAYFILKKTSFGRKVYSIGANEVAAYLCGVKVIRIKILVYTLAGFIAGIGGIIAASRMGFINQQVGTGLEFQAITAVILGGTNMQKGGIGDVEKTLLGAIIVGLIANYFTLKGISPYYLDAVTGLVIVFAAYLNKLLHHRD